MKRHPALEPFSRDHNDGLILARKLQKAEADSAEAAQTAWGDELRDHFAEEERILGPLCEPHMAERLFAEHVDVANRIDALPADPIGLGELLERHIRWEERVLFPAIEASAGPEELSRIAREAATMEERRWPNDARRADLVRRRITSK